jgi:hypothetical protein
VTPAETTFQDVVLWVIALSSLVSFGTVVWNIFSGPSKKNGAAITELLSRLALQDIEVQRLRDKVAALPDAEMMHRLELSMVRMEGNISQIDERIRPVAAIAARMQDLLIEQGRK